MKQATPKKTTRGRSETDPVDQLRTKVWYRSVQVASGKDKNYALARRIEELQGHEEAPPARTLLRYKNGDRVPQRGEAQAFVVDIAESHFSGTRAYFESPLWDVLKQRQFSVAQLDSFLQSLGTPVKAILFAERPEADGGPYALTLDFVAATRLIALRSFEAFVALVLLVVKSEAIAQPGARNAARDAYIDMQEDMDADPVIGPFAAEIYRFADKVCSHWHYPTNQKRVAYVEDTHRDNVRAAFERAGAVRVPWPDKS